MVSSSILFHFQLYKTKSRPKDGQTLINKAHPEFSFYQEKFVL